MKRQVIVRYLLFAGLLLGCIPMRVQANLVRHYTISEGLSNNAVYRIFQDDKGRMWFGTIDGLHSFDGHEIRVWRDTTAVAPGPTIYALAEDDDYRLWVGSDRGLSLLDLKQERYVPLEARTTLGVPINCPVSHILKDSRGSMWVGTFGQGVFRYDPTDGKLVQYTLGRLNTEYIICLLEDSEGTIWTASRSEGISRFESEKDRFVHVAGGKEEVVISLFEDHAHRLWAGSNRNGLYRVYPDEERMEQVLKPFGRGGVMQVRCIVERLPGRLLLASDDGLTCFMPENGEIELLEAQLEHPHAMNDNYLQTLYLDREGALWAGSYFGGVNYFSPESDNFEHYRRGMDGLSARIVSVMARADGDNLWIGSDDGGFFYWNRKENRFRNYLPDGRTDGPTYHNVHALLQAGDKLFIGMYMGGLDIMDLKSGRIRNYMPSSSSRSLYATGIYAAYQDSCGQVWIGTTLGLNRYEPRSDDFERIFETHEADISYIMDDRKGHLWVCSSNRGVFRLTRAQGMWDHFSAEGEGKAACGLPTDRIITGAVDEENILWFGSNGDGLLRFDEKTEQFSRVPLDSDVRVIYKIIPYRGCLWLTTSNGLYQYDPRTGLLNSFNKEDGLQDNEFLPNSGLSLPDGTLFVGGINGFNMFRPDAMVNSSTKTPPVILSDFRLFNLPIGVGEKRSPLDTSITYADKLTLNYDHNIFSLQVATLSYVNPSKHSYRYKLEGLEREWTLCDVAPRVSYTNLRPGHYTFRVSVSTGDGRWCEDAICLPIRVRPPWWFSSPALIAYVLCFALLMCFFYRLLVHRQQQRLERLAMEKDKELYQSKIDFFTQMIHELRTPLTLILAPLRQVMMEGGTVGQAMPRLQMVERNGERLYALVNQLMDFRKTESGEMSVRMEPVELKGMLAGIVQQFVWAAESKEIRLVQQLPEGSCWATTDGEAFTKMVSNLLSNAMKFAATQVGVSLKALPDGRWELRVADDGPGIAPEHQEKIFKAFFQVRENRPNDYIGTGIGLALVQKLATLTGAEVQLESEPGQGAVFLLRLQAGTCKEEEPAAPAAALPVPQPTSPEAEVLVDNGHEQLFTLLLVDDNADMLSFLHDVLKEHYRVRCATNGREALDMMKQPLPDLVVSDVMMPVMDGLELCRRIKGDLRTSHVPVILLTAKGRTEDQVEGLDSGADLYLPKPFSTEVIRAQISSLLRNRERVKAQYQSEPLACPELSSGSSLDKEFMERVNAIIERRMTDSDFSVDQLAQEVGVSRTGLFTKIKALFGMTPNDFIRLNRLKKAAALLAQGDVPVSEACWQVGFSSTSYFSKCFQSQFGVTPNEFRHGKK